MKRIHLFELEDQSWFPGWLRQCMTRLMVVMHNLLGSSDELSELIGRALLHSEHQKIIDLCSGSGGAMIEVLQALRRKDPSNDVELVLTDLNPDTELVHRLNLQRSGITYIGEAVDATRVSPTLKGLRTMVCSFHHMRPEVARKILKDARDERQPICIFEISDNSLPAPLWWIALPINFLMTFFITPVARPMTWKQIVFTYVVPVIPAVFAWDGAVSNARTYTLQDMDELTEGLESEDYRWEKGRIGGRAKKLYLLGLPLNR